MTGNTDCRKAGKGARVMNEDRDRLVGHLRELMKQWQCTAALTRSFDTMGAAAIVECAVELGEILDGDLSPIERWCITGSGGTG